ATRGCVGAGGSRLSNGTFVDGERVEGEAPLAPGATVRLGDVQLVFEPADDAVAATGGGGGREGGGRTHVLSTFQEPRPPAPTKPEVPTEKPRAPAAPSPPAAPPASPARRAPKVPPRGTLGARRPGFQPLPEK